MDGAAVVVADVGLAVRDLDVVQFGAVLVVDILHVGRVVAFAEQPDATDNISTDPRAAPAWFACKDDARGVGFADNTPEALAEVIAEYPGIRVFGVKF